MYSNSFTIPDEGDQQIFYYSDDVIGNIEKTNILYVVVDNTPPAVPEALTYYVHKSNIYLTWKSNTEWDLAGYNIHRNGNKLNTNLLTNTFYYDLNLPYGDYSYSISALDRLGNESDPCSPVSITLDGCLIISNPEEESNNRKIIIIWADMICRGEFKELNIEYGDGYFSSEVELLKNIRIMVKNVY